MHPLIRMVATRLLWGLASLVFVSMLIFAAVEMLPGDFAEAILGQSATPQAVARIRAELGLDQPAAARYLSWLSGVLHGDFGNSLSGRGAGVARPVAALVLPRLGNTALLAAMAALIAFPLAFRAGMAAATRRGSLLDRGLNLLALAFVAMPEFLIGYVLIYWLAIRAGIFPPLATIGGDTPVAERLWRMILPAVSLSLPVMAHILRMTRASLSEMFERPWMEMARLKGLPRDVAVRRHALPAAIGTLANIFAFNIAWLITGVVVTEVVFVYPGIGQLMVDAVASRDIPVVQACALIFAAMYIGLNLIADIIALVTNPRILHPR